MTKIKCPSCNGSRQVYNPSHGPFETGWSDCVRCQGLGFMEGSTWLPGPLPPNTFMWGGVVPHEIDGKPYKGGGFYFADFYGDHVKVVGPGKEMILKPHEIAWYNNSLDLPPQG